ncbi:MAG: hypothetical protein WB783_08715, partial [Arenicellales bacterium]
MSSTMPLPKSRPGSKETWVDFDGYIADLSSRDALLRSNRDAGGAILVKKGDYEQFGKKILLRVGAQVTIVEQPNALPGNRVDSDCGDAGSACIGGDKICCAE